MDIVEIYDHYYYDKPMRMFNTGCSFTVCQSSILYRRLAAIDRREPLVDILEYMLYNVSNETGLPSYYCCCMSFDGGHVCNAIPIMIGSELEKNVVLNLCSMLDLDSGALYDQEYYHKVFVGTFLVNGTFYYSVFRESNNNKICHNKKSKFRGTETVCYFYDITYNRGIKLFTKAGESGLFANDRDGKEIANVNENTLQQLYKECLARPELYTLDMPLVQGFFDSVEKEGLGGIDNFKNKIYTNFSIGLNTFLDKLHPSAMTHPMWNTSLMMGKINLGISQRLSYPKTKSEAKKLNEQKLKMCTGGLSTGYLVETQRRRNTRKVKSGGVQTQRCVKQKRRIKQNSAVVVAAAATECTKSLFGSNEVKTLGLIEKLENGERSGPSTFNQVSVSNIPLIKVLSSTVQKLQVEHVHAESSKTVPEDASGFICMKYVGNISTAGKNMLFTDRVFVSFGHVRQVVALIEFGLETALSLGLVTCHSTEKIYCGEYGYSYIDKNSNRKPKTSYEHCGNSFTDKNLNRKSEMLCEEYKNLQNVNHTAEQSEMFFEEYKNLYIENHTSRQSNLFSKETFDKNKWPLLHIVINNAVTKFAVSSLRVVDFLIFAKVRIHRFAWIKVVANYLCVYFYEGVPLLAVQNDEYAFRLLYESLTTQLCADILRETASICLSRHEMELLHEYKQTLADICNVSSGTRNPGPLVGRHYDVYACQSHFDPNHLIKKSQPNSVHFESNELIKKSQSQSVHFESNELIKKSQSQSVHFDPNEPIKKSQSQSVHFDPNEPIKKSQTQSLHIDPNQLIKKSPSHSVHFDSNELIKRSPSHSVHFDLFKSRLRTSDLNHLIHQSFRKYDVDSCDTHLYKRYVYENPAAEYEASCNDRQSVLAKHMDQFTDFTPPSKRSVSVNARKSACVNVYYKRAADLVRGFNMFTDPDAFEEKQIQQNLVRNDIPTRVTASAFTSMRCDKKNCPQPQYADPSLKNFYMMRTIFGDIGGHNVEDANVIDSAVDLCLTFAYSFSLTFVDRTARGVKVVVPDARNSVQVCAWDDNGEPTAVLFLLCTIYTDTSAEHEIQFPPFRKVSVIKDLDGSYRVYMLRNDAVLMRAINNLRQYPSTFIESNDEQHTNHKPSTFTGWEAECHTNHKPSNFSETVVGNDTNNIRKTFSGPEVNPYEALTSLQTRVMRFKANDIDRVVYVDFRASGRADKYDGIKVLNSFGQKGLALVKDVGDYVRPSSDNSLQHSPVQLVMNICSFVSRQPIGQYLQMRRNFCQVTTSTAGEPCLSGFSAVYFTEGEPTTKTCLVRLDEMMRSVIITVGLSCFQNIKASLDNVYNPQGVMCPPQTRQILDLYRCYGVAYRISGDDYTPYASRDDVRSVLRLYEACAKRLRALDTGRSRSKAVLDLSRILQNINVEEKFRRLCGLVRVSSGSEFIVSLSSADENRMPGESAHSNETPPEHIIDSYVGSTGQERRTRLIGDPNEIFRMIDDSGEELERFATSWRKEDSIPDMEFL